MTHRPLDRQTEALLRELAPQVLGNVLRRFPDFAAAEDAVQEALIAAASQWPVQGRPEHPRAWLTQVAVRRLTDAIRQDAARRRREATIAGFVPAEVSLAWPDAGGDVLKQDDTLALLFLCCHPALSTASAIALTLRAVGGLTTAEIASAFLVPEATMAQRISRAKSTLKESGLPFELPEAEERASRLGTVLHVLYLIFNEGYTSSHGQELVRVELSSEAIRLTRLAHALVPDDGETAGLLALMLLTDARRLARVGPAGELIPLMEQDRSRWDQAAIAEGIDLLSRTLPREAVGEYQIQAAIAAVHDEAARPEDTDWAQILALYERLKGLSESPVVALNHAVAVAMVHGPRAGLTLLDGLAAGAKFAEHHRLIAARAHLLERAGDVDAAISHYRAAAERTESLAERSYLLLQAARLAQRGGAK